MARNKRKVEERLAHENDAVCFWRFPREIRDAVYGFLLSTEATKIPSKPLRCLFPSAFYRIRYTQQLATESSAQYMAALSGRKSRHARERQASALAEWKEAENHLSLFPVVLDNAAFAVNRQMLDEIRTYIQERVSVEFSVKWTTDTWSERALKELRTVQNILVKYTISREHANSLAPPFSMRAKTILRKRGDVKSFHFYGTGHQILEDSRFEKRAADGKWVRIDNLRASRRISDVQLHEQIIAVLRETPRISTSKSFEPRWQGDDKIPHGVEGDEMVQMFYDVMEDLGAHQ